MSLHVLVPVDGSEGSERALEYALDELPEATITLIHVVNPVSTYSYGGDDYFDAEGYQAAMEQRREKGQKLLAACREIAADRGVDAESILTPGSPAEEILEAAEADGVDQIVMGSRGRSGVSRVLFGSVAETVTRRASVPVTIVR